MLFLTAAELIELTERKRRSEQIAWLKQNGFPFVVGANGNPKVFREYIQTRLSQLGKGTAIRGPEPNWSAL